MAGWRFRRSIRGPLGIRWNFSRRGVGISAGVRGLRIGRDARGRNYTAASVPGTGIYRRDYAPGRPPSPRTSPTSGIVLFLLVISAVLIAYAVVKVLAHF
jgi:Protein of unknown function (DUF4236)